MEDSAKYALAAAAGAAVIGAGIYYRKEIGGALPSLPDFPNLPFPASAPSYADRLLSAVYELLPEPDSTLQEPDPRWDWVLGGKTSSKNIWGYYQWAEGAKYGTTCGIFAAACMSKADWPRELINRKVPEGNGYRATWHIAQIHEGATKLGWLWNWDRDHPVPASKPGVAGWGSGTLERADRLPAQIWTIRTHVLGAADGPPLVPGDVYCQTRDYTDSKGIKRRNEHVGIVLTVDRDGDAWRIETADGGQTTPSGRQMAARVRRRLRGGTLTNLQNGAAGDMRWLARSVGSPKDSPRGGPG